HLSIHTLTHIYNPPTSILYTHVHQTHSHSFPTRRSSDLNDVIVQAFVRSQGNRLHLLVRVPLKAMRDINFPERGPGYLEKIDIRSEEHTSELQSHLNLVCRLLLEKKK